MKTSEKGFKLPKSSKIKLPKIFSVKNVKTRGLLTKLFHVESFDCYKFTCIV